MKNILIVDDEVNIALLLSKFLIRNGFEVTIASNGTAALELLKSNSYHLVLCDFRLEDTDGREILKKVKTLYPQTGVIIITGYSDVKMAVELIKMGAYDYITKPLYPDEILKTINKALEIKTGVSELGSSKITQNTKETKTSLTKEEFVVGNSRVSRELARQIKLVAPTNYSVIIIGESGTGKESVAKSIHLQSDRRDKPFVAMDCGSLTKELAGSEFFGHEKGAFTGAMYTKIGHFEMANGGTLFLDEIGNLSYDIQAALLRTVQERKVKRIGSTKEIDLDVRIIIATNDNLPEAIAKGKFREDLYHRFNEFSIIVPPLRDRSNDILILSEYFLKLANQELGQRVTRLSPEVLQLFMTYNWPGNVRELKNVIRRAALLTEGEEIFASTLPMEIANTTLASPAKVNQSMDHPSSSDKNRALKSTASEAEYEAIMQVLKEVNFNKTKAAEILNIDRKTLYNKMKATQIGK
ncbi:MAG: sigma-54-dependent transcriptional regulator [Sphingobacteriaceae bacterium]